MIRTLLVLACFALPAQADDTNVSIRFLGGAKQVPLADLTVIIRKHTGDWSVDHKKSLTDGKTDQDGRVAFTLADGWYYVDIQSAKDIPYLDRPVGFQTPPNIYSRMIQVGQEQSFEFNLADACKLTLRAVDVDTGKGIPGVCFVTESETAEQWGIALVSDNLGANRRQQGEELTDENGRLIRLMGPREGYTYYALPVPEGYEPAGRWEVSLPTPIGGKPVEHVFKFRKKGSICLGPRAADSKIDDRDSALTLPGWGRSAGDVESANSSLVRQIEANHASTYSWGSSRHHVHRHPAKFRILEAPISDTANAV